MALGELGVRVACRLTFRSTRKLWYGPRMLAAGLFAASLIIGFIVLDWWYFNRPEAHSAQYGCPIGSLMLVVEEPAAHLRDASSGAARMVPLSHGRALWFPDARRIVLLADCRRFASRFRTAWPLKGSVVVQQEPQRLTAVCTKRTPWSSAVITALWFLLVGGGSLGFAWSFSAEGGFASMTGMMVGVGVLALGALVLFFGLVTVAMAYRIENDRLLKVWDEWRATLDVSPAEPSPADASPADAS